MLQGRRKVLALLAVLGVAFVAPGVSSGQDTAAGAFLESLTHDVFTKLDDTSLSQTEKERDPAASCSASIGAEPRRQNVRTSSMPLKR
jgi:hypothetical protein